MSLLDNSSEKFPAWWTTEDFGYDPVYNNPSLRNMPPPKGVHQRRGHVAPTSDPTKLALLSNLYQKKREMGMSPAAALHAVYADRGGDVGA